MLEKENNSILESLDFDLNLLEEYVLNLKNENEEIRNRIIKKIQILKDVENFDI